LVQIASQHPLDLTDAAGDVPGTMIKDKVDVDARIVCEENTMVRPGAADLRQKQKRSQE